jgi:hypothetical protein
MTNSADGEDAVPEDWLYRHTGHRVPIDGRWIDQDGVVRVFYAGGTFPPRTGRRPGRAYYIWVAPIHPHG